MIQLHEVHKSFPDGTQALKDISVTLPEGKLTVVIGPSGCGKSTLLDMACGLLTPSRGRVSIDGMRKSVDGTGQTVYQAPPEMTTDEAVALVGNAWVLGKTLQVNSLPAIRERLAAARAESLDHEEFFSAQTILVIQHIEKVRGKIGPVQKRALKAAQAKWLAIEKEREALEKETPQAPPLLMGIAGKTYTLQEN